MPESYNIEFLIKARNEAESALKQVKSQVDDISHSMSGMNNVLEGAMGALAAYAGTKGLMGLVGAYEEANRMLVKSQFFLKGMGGDTQKNLAILKQWGAEVQRNIGINDEFAVLVASRLAPRIKDLNKIQEYALTLLKGHRIGVLDAESASIMLMRAAEGNTRAMTWLAFQLGITVHEFESMDSVMAKVKQRLDGLTDLLSPFDRAWVRLKETMGDLREEAGLPLVNVFGAILDFIFRMMKQFPIFGETVKFAITTISGALAGLGIGILTSKILAALGITGIAFAPWAAVITGAIFTVIYAVGKLAPIFEENKKIILLVLSAILMGFFVLAIAIGSPIAIIVAAIALIAFAGLTIYTHWKDIEELLIILWKNLKEKALNIWTDIKTNFETVINDIVKFFQPLINTIQSIISLAERAWSAITRLPGMVGTAVSRILPTRQFGGYIPETGMYMLHRGEMVNPARQGGAGAITINLYGNTFMGDEEGAVKIGDMIIRALQRQLRI